MSDSENNYIVRQNILSTEEPLENNLSRAKINDQLEKTDNSGSSKKLHEKTNLVNTKEYKIR